MQDFGKEKHCSWIEKIIKKYCPEYIFVPEFSILTIQVLLIKYLYNYKYKVISICDDSYDMLMGNDFPFSTDGHGESLLLYWIISFWLIIECMFGIRNTIKKVCGCLLFRMISKLEEYMKPCYR